MLTISYCQGRVNCAILHVTHSIQTLVIFRLWPGCGVPLPQVIITPYVTDSWTSQVLRKCKLTSWTLIRCTQATSFKTFRSCPLRATSSLTPRWRVRDVLPSLRLLQHLPCWRHLKPAKNPPQITNGPRPTMYMEMEHIQPNTVIYIV